MKLLHKTLTAILALHPVLAPLAQAQEVCGQDHDFIYATSPWLSSGNAAGLCTMPTARSGYAQAAFGKQDGGLCGINDSADSFDAGVQTETIIKVSDRLYLQGRLEYNYFRGKNMGGPIFLDPSYNPLNLYEFDEKTVGIKNKEMYSLSGGIAYNFNEKWSIGGKISYESTDRTKLKDPRCMTVWMDLGVSAGFRYAPSDAFSFGANFTYRRTLEQVGSDIIGVTAEKYFTFIDLGGFYGSRELMDGGSYISLSETRPMFNSFYGGSIQIEAGRKTKVFNEISFLSRSGYYGKKSSSTVTFTEHSSNVVEYHGVLLTGSEAFRHRVGLDFRYEGLANNENIYRMNTEVGEYTKVEYLGQNEVLKQTDLGVAISYTGYVGIENFRPKWEFGAAIDADRRSSLTTIYPFYRSSSVARANARIFGSRNIVFKQKNVLFIGLLADFAMGFGNPKNDGILASSTSDAPRSADVYLNLDFEYKTAMRAGAQATVRYTRMFRKLAAYIEVSDSYIHLFKTPEYLAGNYRNILETKIGISF